MFVRRCTTGPQATGDIHLTRYPRVKLIRYNYLYLYFRKQNAYIIHTYAYHVIPGILQQCGYLSIPVIYVLVLVVCVYIYVYVQQYPYVYEYIYYLLLWLGVSYFHSLFFSVYFFVFHTEHSNIQILKYSEYSINTVLYIVVVYIK